jgi:hypothetical protein
MVWNTTALSSSIYAEYEERNKVEQWVMSCMKHGAAYINNELHLCKPANVWIEKGKDLR